MQRPVRLELQLQLCILSALICTTSSSSSSHEDDYDSCVSSCSSNYTNHTSHSYYHDIHHLMHPAYKPKDAMFSLYTVGIICVVMVAHVIIKAAQQHNEIIGNMPFTLTIFIVGLGLAALVGTKHDEPKRTVIPENECEFNHGSAQASFRDIGWCAIDASKRIDPHIILLIMLPPLIYESASHLDWYVFKRCFDSIFTLALPGVIFSFWMIAVLNSSMLFDIHETSSVDDDAWYDDTVMNLHDLVKEKHVWQDDHVTDNLVERFWSTRWSFNQHLTLGAILAATDPVAVVAALHELGAPKPLSTVIDGESLLNDGSAMVMFLIFLSKGFDQPEPGKESDSPVADGFSTFFQLSLGGAAFGCVMFIGLYSWLMFVTHEWSSCTISVLLAIYATFFISEVLLKVSGVLAVVMLGLLMAWFGKYAISPSAVEEMDSAIEIISMLCESSIFFFAGIVSYGSIRALTTNEQVNHGTAFGNLIIIYIIIHFVRALSIGLFSWLFTREKPLFTHDRYVLSYKELAICWFGGLRGAVGLALGLLVVVTKNETYTAIREELMFYVSGIVFMTLFINGNTITFVYKWLDPFPEKAKKRQMREERIQSAMEYLEKETARQTIRQMSGDWLHRDIIKEDATGARPNLDLLQFVIPMFHDVSTDLDFDKQNEKCVRVSPKSALIIPETHSKISLKRYVVEKLLPHCTNAENNLGGGYEDQVAVLDHDWRRMSTATSRPSLPPDHLPAILSTHDDNAKATTSSDGADGSSAHADDEEAPLAGEAKEGSEDVASPNAPAKPSRPPAPAFWGEALPAWPQKGDEVIINKEGSHIKGAVGRVIDPEWNSMVKIQIVSTIAEEGEIKSYHVQDLKPVDNEVPFLVDIAGAAMDAGKKNWKAVKTMMKMSSTRKKYKPKGSRTAKEEDEQRTQAETYCSTIFHNALTALYRHQFEQHELTEKAMSRLDEAQHAGMAYYEDQIRDFDKDKELPHEVQVDKHDTVLERAMMIELNMVMKTLPDPTNEFLLKFAGYAMWLGDKFRGCGGFMKGTAKFLIYRRIFACVEILCGFIRAHEELPHYLEFELNEEKDAAKNVAHLHPESGEFTPGLERRNSSIAAERRRQLITQINTRLEASSKKVVDIAKKKLVALQRSWPHAVYITKMILTGQAMVKIKMEEMTKLHQHGIITESDLHELLKPLSNTLEHFQHAQYTYSLGKSVKTTLPIHLKRIKAIGGLKPGWEEKLKRGFSHLDGKAMSASRDSIVTDKELKKMFDKLDSDGSGSLERAELEELMRMLGQPMEKVDQYFADSDADGDGQLDFDEFRKVFREGESKAQMNADSAEPASEPGGMLEAGVANEPEVGVELAVARDLEEGGAETQI